MSNNNVSPEDDFFLNFGSSANVCDQLRHSIRQEVTEIDASIVKMEDESRKEDRLSQELIRSLAHARTEMCNLRRFALDVVDSSKMNETLRLRALEDLRTGLVSPFLLNERNPSHGELTDDADLSPVSVTYVDECKEEIKVLLMNSIKCKDNTLAVMDEKRALQTSLTSHQRVRESENLEEMVKLAQNNVKELLDGLENEKRRLRISNEAVHDARTKSGFHAEEIANYTKTLTAHKARHEQERKEWATMLAEEEDELHRLKSTDNIERQVREAARAVDDLRNQLAEANSARQRYSDIQQCLESLEKEITELEEDTARTEAAIVEQCELAALARQQHQEIKAFEEQILAQKLHNDRTENEKILPGQQEVEELKKTSESLVISITEAHSIMETELRKLLEDLKVKRAAVDELDSEIKIVTMENDQALDALAQMKKALEQQLESAEKECSENLEIARKFTEAVDAERSRLDELTVAKERKREQRLEEARERSAEHRHLLEEKLEVYKRALAMIAEVEAHRHELARLEEKILLDK